ncbi:hypothetical protein ACWERY_02170 [Streptomyces sp. NPDC004082]
MANYAWSAEVLITGQGLHDARGAHRSNGSATETELKAAVARDVAKRHGCTPSDVLVLEFTYSQVPA